MADTTITSGSTGTAAPAAIPDPAAAPDPATSAAGGTPAGATTPSPARSDSYSAVGPTIDFGTENLDNPGNGVGKGLTGTPLSVGVAVTHSIPLNHRFALEFNGRLGFVHGFGTERTLEQLLGEDVAPEEDAPQIADPDNPPCIPDPTTGECPDDGSGNVQPEDYNYHGNVKLDYNGFRLDLGLSLAKLFGPRGRGFGLHAGLMVYLEGGEYQKGSYGPLQFDTWGPYQEWLSYFGLGVGGLFGAVFFGKNLDVALDVRAQLGNRWVAFDVLGRDVDSPLAPQPTRKLSIGPQLTLWFHEPITPTIDYDYDDDEPKLPCPVADAAEKGRFDAMKTELAKDKITVKFNGKDVEIDKEEALTKFGMPTDTIDSLRVEMRPVANRDGSGNVVSVTTQAVLVMDVVDPTATPAGTKGDAVLMDAQSNPLQPLTLEALRQYVAQNYLFVTKEEEKETITKTLEDLNFVVAKPSASQMDSLRRQITGSTLTDDQVRAMFAGVMQSDSIDALLTTARLVKDGTLKGRAFKLIGHASTEGSESSNLALSQRRAEAVYLFFWATGIDRSLMTHSRRGEV